MEEIKVEHIVQDGARSETANENDTAPIDQAEVVWDEERILAALDRLKEMYIQLRELRTSIPRLIAPLTVKQPSPEILFKKFSAAAATANEELKQFKQLIENDDSQKIFQQAKDSRDKNPKGITPWRITQHPDWLGSDKLKSLIW